MLLSAKNTPTHIFEQVIKALLCLLLLALLGAIGTGVLRTFIDLGNCFQGLLTHGHMEEHFKWFLVDVLTVLAMLEVFRTAMAYFTEGRVKVTYLIDTVLVTVLSEILAFWYRDIETTRMIMVIALVFTLMVVRIMAIRFSPKRRELADGL